MLQRFGQQQPQRLAPADVWQQRLPPRNYVYASGRRGGNGNVNAAGSQQLVPSLSNLIAVPARCCSYLDNNALSGTLPPAWAGPDTFVQLETL